MTACSLYYMRPSGHITFMGEKYYGKGHEKQVPGSGIGDVC